MEHNYIVKQHNFAGSSDERDTNKFLECIPFGEEEGYTYTVQRINFNSNFEECLYFNKSFDSETIYYLHAKVKRLNDNFTLNILLANPTDNDNEFSTQFLKSINIKKLTELQINTSSENGITVLDEETESKWYDIEVIFKPNISNYNYLIFQMVRTNSNLGMPTIVYEELSRVKNYKENSIDESNTTYKIIKFGIQANPGTVMCINGQEIHMGKSGIYEIRNGIIYLEYFSIAQAASEIDDPDKTYNRYVTNPSGSTELNNITTFEKLLDELFNKNNNSNINEENNNNNNYTYSQCIFSHPKERTIDSFTLDYIYTTN